MPGRIGERGKVAHRRIDRTVFVEDAGPHERPGVLGLERIAESGEGAGMDHQVRVADEDPFRRGRLPRQRSQAPVHSGAEADVAAGPHNDDGTGPDILERGGGAARGTVLHHHDGRSPVLEEGADAACKQRSGVVVDDDGGDVVRHPVLSTPG